MRERFLDDARGLEEIDGVVVVLLDAGRDGENVRVEDDVLGRETGPGGEQLVRACADADLFVARRGLTLFVEGHHDGGGAVAADEPGAAQKFFLAVLERDRVYDALALQALQPLLEHAPLRRIEHDRHPADLGLGGDEVEELHHGRLTVDQRLVDVDVDDVGATLDLLAGDGETRVPVARLQRLRELGRAGDVGALADDEE